MPSFEQDSRINFDSSDSRKNVNELASALREDAATYFTYACNQSRQPGVQQVFNAINECYPEHKTSEEIRKAAIQAEMVTLVRCWQRASSNVIDYIENSPEEPLGPV